MKESREGLEDQCKEGGVGVRNEGEEGVGDWGMRARREGMGDEGKQGGVGGSMQGGGRGRGEE